MLIAAIVMFISIIFMTLVHELAHMLTAKLFKIPVVEFAIGFGPKLFQRTWRGTVYTIRLLPFGGYCSFTDAEDVKTVADKLDVAVSDKNLYDVPSWQRALVLLAGPFSNMILGFICLMIAGITPVETVEFFATMFGAFLKNIGSIFNPSIATSGGMAYAAVQMADIVMSSEKIWRGFWVVSGGINLLLCLTNLIPFPALDGFSAYWALAETICKKKFSIKLESKLKLLGTIAIYILMFLCCVGDVIHIGETKMLLGL